MTALNTLITSFNQDITRDLAWSVFAPPLLNSTGIPAFRPQLTDSRIEWLKTFDTQKHSINPDYRLGRYYESLWKLFFENDTQYEWIAQNIAIQRAGQTLGEIDFIVRDHATARFLHIEVAVKFYLLHPDHDNFTHPESNILTINDNRQWLGPNSKDNLERKWQHLTHHQCTLSKQPEAIQALKKLHVDCNKLDQSLCLKGYAFSPLNKNNKPCLFNDENTLYHYFTVEEFKKTMFKNCIFSIIPKQHWLTQVHEKRSLVPLNYLEICNHAEKANSPIMIAELNENLQQFIEKKRFFITPPSWP